MWRLALLLCIFSGWSSLFAQAIPLSECDRPYVDPQEAGDGNGQNRDTLYYETFFEQSNQLRAFYIDINAFGGQQTDRTRVYAILPDSSRKEVGSLEFGNCVNCVTGFALVHQQELLVESVDNEQTMNMWLQSLGQPAYELPGNLQTLTGVGRLSGTLPACAIGMYVEYSVYSNPDNASTEFATYIHCPVIQYSCAPILSLRSDCPADSLFLAADVPPDCFSAQAQMRWTDGAGWSSDGRTATRRLSGHLGTYYFEVIDSCCTVIDSVSVAIPSFAEAGEDIQLCAGSPLELSGSGGQEHYWEFEGERVSSTASLRIDPAGPEHSGAYVLYAFNEEGCGDTDSLIAMVAAPVPPEITAGTPCLGDTLYLQVNNPTAYQQISWRHPDGSELPEAYVPDFQPEDVGEYQFAATDTAGCALLQHLAVSGAPLPAFEPLIEKNCDSTRVYLSPETYQYQWSDGEQGSERATVTGGDFQLTVTDAVGCSAIAALSIPAPEGPEYTVEAVHPACPGEGGTVLIRMADADLPVIFSIDGGETYGLSAEFTDLAPGAYTLVVQDELGCIQQREVLIPAPDTMGVRLPVERIDVRPNTPVQLTAETVGQIVAYQWVPAIIDSGGPSTEFVANQDMDIRLIVQDQQGCYAVAALPLTIVLGEIYVPNAFSPDGDGRNDGFTFYSDLGSGEEIAFLRIYDRQGGLVFTTTQQPLNDEQRGWDGQYRGRPAAAGVYVYHGAVRFGNGLIREFKGDVSLLR